MAILDQIQKYVSKGQIEYNDLIQILEEEKDLTFKEVLGVLNDFGIVIVNKSKSMTPPASLYEIYQKNSNEDLYQMYVLASKNRDEMKMDAIKMALLTKPENKNVIKKFALKYAFNKDYLGDLMNAGSEGILHALATYANDKGTKFSTYLYSTVQFYIMDCSYGFQDFKVSSGVRTKLKKLSKELEEKNHSSEDEIIKDFAKKEDISEDRVRDYLQILNRGYVGSLNTKLDTDEDSSIIDNLRGSMLSPEEELLTSAQKGLLYEAIDNNLKDKEKDILITYYGLNGVEAKKISEIAKEYNVSSQRISTIISTALKKLKTIDSLKNLNRVE